MASETQDRPAGRAAGRVAALDLGKARVGLAVTDDLRMLAHPRKALDGSSQRELLAELARITEAEGVERYIVGWPLSLSGAETTAAQRAARFCQKLADATGCDVELVDERLTTVQAERELRAAGCSKAEIKQKVDSAAAALILQQWIDSQPS